MSDDPLAGFEKLEPEAASVLLRLIAARVGNRHAEELDNVMLELFTPATLKDIDALVAKVGRVLDAASFACFTWLEIVASRLPKPVEPQALLLAWENTLEALRQPGGPLDPNEEGAGS